MKKFLALGFFVFALTTLFSQETENESNLKEKAHSPTIGIGAGTVGFYGDLNDRKYGSPLGGNFGYNIYVLQPITSYLNIKFNLLLTTITEEERSLQRNVNFQSELRSGGIFLEYNFDNILRNKERKVTPFVTVGVEATEFNPKADLEGFGGEKYHYWTDGSIKNIAEDDPLSNIAVNVQRDYDYETDIREAGFNGSKTYSERALTIPVGMGLTFHLNDQFDFRVESVMHLTFSDHIDGITTSTSKDYIGDKAANGNNDHYMYNGISLSYNFQKVEGADKLERLDKGPIDYLATGNTEDYDQDGVIDLIDKCPNTPESVEVDTLGCPLDDDGDGVPNYIDKQLNTEYPQFANDEGVEVTDEMFLKSYLNFNDSSLASAEIIEREFKGTQNRRKSKRYKVKIGEYQKGETPSNMNKLLSIPDLSKIDQGDKSIYAVGNYKNVEDAVNRKAQLEQDGFESTEVLERGNTGKVKSAGKDVNERTPTVSNSTPTTKLEATESVVFRVQLGAFRKKPTQEVYDKVGDIIAVEAGGFFRYMTGSFENFASAAKHKATMVAKGYKDAFVVAYKGGKRVPLKSVGVRTINSDPLLGK